MNPWKDPGSERSGWQSPVDGPALLVEIAEELKKTYPVDPRRVYLFGHSAGAVFALGMAWLKSDYFVAVAIHAGAFRQPGEAAVRATRDAFAARHFQKEKRLS